MGSHLRWRRAERLTRTLERQLSARDAEPATVAESVPQNTAPGAPGGALPAPSSRAAQVARVED